MHPPSSFSPPPPSFATMSADSSSGRRERPRSEVPPEARSTGMASSSESENQSLKPRRPLPTYSQPAAVPASTFYATPSSSKARFNTPVGSSRTTYTAPGSPPPSHVKDHSPFREPELVEEDPIPSLVPAQESWGAQPDWATTTGPTPWDSNTVNADWAGGGWDSSTSKKIEIDGRAEEEEINWCDVHLRDKCQRPGPGLLPPLTVDALHNAEHTLYSVVAAPPAPKGSSPAAGPSSSQAPFSPPSSDEVRTAIPHPNAYYCKEHNGWVLLFWCSSSVLPQFVPGYASPYPFPDLDRRKLTASCIGESEQPFGQANKTHHFHRYPKAVDARMLTTPFRRSDWEDEEHQKRKRRKMTLHLEDESEASTPSERADEDQEADLLDLYVCCQCSVYVLASQVIPGVIPPKFIDEFTRDKHENPTTNKTRTATVLAGWETVITIIENKLWKGENRVLPVTRPKFQSKVGWNAAVRRIFEILGFAAGPLTTAESPESLALHPPSTDVSTPAGKRTRAKLLRAWVELSAWLTIYQKSRTKDLGNYVTQTLSVSVESAREMYQTGVGAHVNQIARGQLPPPLLDYKPLEKSWEALGMTPSSYSPDLLAFAYLAQCRCDPANTITYFTHLGTIFETMNLLGVAPPDSLQMLILEERTRGRFTLDDLRTAVLTLGFGRDNELAVDLDDEVDDQFIIQAWRSGMKRAWRDMATGTQRRTDLCDAFKIVADWRGSARLRQAWEEEKGTGMTPDAAYTTLEVPREVDETMLITVYAMRIEDQPSQAAKMHEALTVIAEVTDSQRLRGFLETGRDPGDVTAITSLDMPRGLNQLGNTCYLNSLLQYFYTIRDLREAVAPLANADAKSLDDSKFSDDDLKRHRVGGRLVTRREILRSKKFVSQLADLFWNLEYCDVPAVTPTLDLAKLALVTSQDEEEDDQDKTGTDASNDTDATLVEDAPPRPYERSSSSPVQSSSGSVLGKRPRDQPQNMDVDGVTADSDKDKESYVMVSNPPSPAGANSPSGASGSSSKQKTVQQDDDVEMQDETGSSQAGLKPPPLPPRKPREVDDSVMMFGRQHDVSECMDNCMFQIETALLDFQEMAGAEDDKTSVVKRLFYGKKRQRLTPFSPVDDRRHQSSIHEKEDLFSHLHVNVADEGHDLYDGLGRYFDDIVEFEGVKKRMEVTLVDLPPLLQIQLQRVQFDRETQQAYKSQAYVKFGETIYMDRFLDSADPAKKARSKAIQAQLSTCRDKIQRLTQGKHAPFAPALGATADFLSTQNSLELPEANEDLFAQLRNEEEFVKSKLDIERANAVKLKEELEDVWQHDAEAAYELTSVFIHRGSSPSFGHYFFYSRHLPDKPDSWFKYNDSDVSAVSKEEVLADTTGSTANPYMLVFARRDSEVIQTVHRFDPETLQDG